MLRVPASRDLNILAMEDGDDDTVHMALRLLRNETFNTNAVNSLLQQRQNERGTSQSSEGALMRASMPRIPNLTFDISRQKYFSAISPSHTLTSRRDAAAIQYRETTPDLDRKPHTPQD